MRAGYLLGTSSRGLQGGVAERCVPAVHRAHLVLGATAGDGARARSVAAGGGGLFGGRRLLSFQGGSSNAKKRMDGGVRDAKPDPLEQYGQLLEKAMKREVVTEARTPNHKRRLQKALSRQEIGQATYETKEVTGEGGGGVDTATFVSEVKVGDKVFSGRGITWGEAENAAAEKCILGLEFEGVLKPYQPQSQSKQQQGTKWSLLPPAGAEWIRVDKEPHRLTPVHERREVPIPELAHGLERVLDRDEKVATSLRHRIWGKGFDKKYLQKIEQPDAINWLAIAPFVPTSRDDRLHELAKEHQAKYKASTSSITGLFSHIYFVTCNWKPVDISDLSDAFKDQPRTFSTTLLKKPNAVLIRPKDGVYGIDSEPERGSNHQILIDLGKTLERMLTMDSEEFRKMMLKSPTGESFKVPEEITASTYNFSTYGKFILRSQLDCVHGDENKIFDLKTRATHAIRNSFHAGPKDLPPKERYKPFISYKIQQQQGLFNSFEREMYDMIRSAFIKYSMQLRIGRMHGALVTYHNTMEIFGFQYVPLSYMDKLIFGSPHMANVHFDSASKILAHLLDTVTASFPKGTTIRMCTTPQKFGRYLLIEACEVLSESVTEPPVGSKDDPEHTLTLGSETISWYLWITTKVNGQNVEQPWRFQPKDDFQVEFCMVRTKDYKPSENSDRR